MDLSLVLEEIIRFKKLSIDTVLSEADFLILVRLLVDQLSGLPPPPPPGEICFSFGGIYLSFVRRVGEF